MKLIKKILLALLIILIIIQFIQPARNTSGQILPTDITKIYAVPDSVQHVLKIACYDCHSNNTTYPWYSKIQPGAWFMANHIENGKADLNFSEFGTYSKRKQEHTLRLIASQITDDEMPVSSYKFIHKNARLSPPQKQLIIQWVQTLKDSLTTKN